MALIGTITLNLDEEYPVSINWTTNGVINLVSTDLLKTSVWIVRTGLTVSDPTLDAATGKTFVWLRNTSTPGVYRLVNRITMNNTATPLVRDAAFEDELQIIVQAN